MTLKPDVKHRAAFRCCWRQAIGVEVHHIVPESQGGPDTIDNVAPLCVKCHADFGDDPHKRNEIGEMRDW
ncbi:MAG: HNH endonuclease [Syntrophobacteraceae bacterium]